MRHPALEIHAFHRATLQTRVDIGSGPYEWCLDHFGNIATVAWWSIMDGVLVTSAIVARIGGDWDMADNCDVLDEDGEVASTFLFRKEIDAVHFKLRWGGK